MHSSSRRRILTVAVAVSATVAAAVAGPAQGSGGPIDPVHAYTKWKVTKVTPLPREHGPWQDCATAQGGSKGSTVHCSHGFSVSNSVSGSVGVNNEVLSASVGFDVTLSTTLDAGVDYAVPKHQQRTIQWAPRYRVKRVNTTQYRCYSGPRGTNCSVKGHGEGVVRNAASVGFRLVR